MSLGPTFYSYLKEYFGAAYYGLIADSVRASERNSMVVSLNTTWANVSSVVNTICMSSFRYTHVIISRKFQLKETWGLTKAIAEIKFDTERIMKLE